MPNMIEGDLYVSGSLSASGGINIPAGAIADAAVVAGAAISAAKLKHLHVEKWSQPNTSATAETRVLHRAKGAGSVITVHAGSIVAATGDSTTTIDIKKNGTTILTGTIVLDSGNVAYTAEAGTISTAAYSAGDVFTAAITISAGTGTLPTGVYVEVAFDEAYS